MRSVFFNIFQSLIVLLYVFDNETNTMVRISVCVGILIELWKVPKILNFEVGRLIRLSTIDKLSSSSFRSACPTKHGLASFPNTNISISSLTPKRPRPTTIEYVHLPTIPDSPVRFLPRLQMAFKYLSWILFPLVLGYACYLLMYHEQKSWYSFCLSTVYGFLLTFGASFGKANRPRASASLLQVLS